MKPIVFTLLLVTSTGQADAQPDMPEQKAAPEPRPASAPAQPAPAQPQPATAAGDMPCPHCNPDEQLVVDLVYYKQVLDILEGINQQRDRIDAGLLQSVHAELIKIRPDLAALLKTRAKAPARPLPAAKKPEQSAPKPAKKPERPAPKPAKARNKPAPKKGIDGLTVGHVNDGDPELGIKTSVVLISNKRPRSLSVGSVIEHNRRKFKIVKVDYVQDRGKGNRHEVHLEDQTSKRVHVVPWQ